MKTDTMIALFVLGALGYLIYQKAQGGTAGGSNSVGTGASSSLPPLLPSGGSSVSLQPVGVNLPSVGPINFQPDFGLNAGQDSSWD
jgi:hypothetical protein